MKAPFCKPVFLRTTDSKTGAVSKLRAMLGMILNWDTYLITLELHQIGIMTFAKQMTWYYSHLQQKGQLLHPEYFLDNKMIHDRTNDAEILPFLVNQWFAHNQCSFLISWNSWGIDLWLILHWHHGLLQSCDFMLQRSLYSHCFICSSNWSIHS